MNVDRDVILDLLPVYLAGEASPASRSLVEAHLAGDPELAARVRALAAASGHDAAAAAPPPELELVALRRARRMIALQRWLFGFGLMFTAFSLSMVLRIEHGRILSARLLLLDLPVPLGLMGFVGVGCFVGYAVLRRRLRGSGAR